MNENNDVPNKITIKVKLSDEDYKDIVLDWSDESCEYKQQLFMKNLASYTGLPIENIKDVFFWGRRHTVHNLEYKFRRFIPKPVKNENFMSFFNDGDCFYLATAVGIIQDPYDFFVGLYLATPNQANGSQCDIFWCHYANTRAYMNKRKEIFKDNELKARLGAARRRWHEDNGAEYVRLKNDFAIHLIDLAHVLCSHSGALFEPEWRDSSYRG